MLLDRLSGRREPAADPGGPPPRRRAARPWAALALVLGVIAVLGFAAGRLLGGGGDDGAKGGLADLPSPAAAPEIRPERQPAQVVARRLPLNRLVSQMFAVGLAGPRPSRAFVAGLRTHDWGAIVFDEPNFRDPLQFRALTSKLSLTVRRARHLPPLLAYAGPSTRSPASLGRLNRPSLAKADARSAGRRLMANGLNMTLEPPADVTAPEGPFEESSFADDPAVVTRFVAAALAGYRQVGMIAAVGQFPGAGAASGDPDLQAASVGLSLPELEKRDLRPFAAVAGRAPVIALSNALYAAFGGATPASLSPEVGKLLRKRLGFRGVAMTADLPAAATTTGSSIGPAAVAAVRAGADLLYVPGGPREQEAAYRAVVRAARREEISIARLRASVARIVALKRRHGLFVRLRRLQAPRRGATE